MNTSSTANPASKYAEFPDVLAHRYASPAMLQIWSAEERILLERELWIAVLQAQQSLGVNISQADIDACQRVKKQISLESIRQRECQLRHDVKARLEEFCALAGHQHLHMGLTSRDVTDNVEQLQLKRALSLLLHKAIAVLLRLANWAERHAETPLAARTHNIPAQPTSLGKRLASFGESLLLACEQLQTWIQQYPLRGIKGAVGTHLDLIALLPKGEQDTTKLEKMLAESLGFSNTLAATGQVYPRELDFEAASIVYRLTAPLASLATTLRLMAGHGLWSEGFRSNQVGSSAMPHKVNARSCERISGLHVVLGGYLEMCTRLAGSQWNEGDVSCSVVRRVVFPGISFAADGLLETALTVLNEMDFFEEVLAQEIQRELPLMASSTLLMEATQRSEGRETMHELLKQHALAAAADLRSGKKHPSFAQRLGGDSRFPLSQTEIESIIGQSSRWLAAAPQQARQFAYQTRKLAKKYPQALNIKPAPLL